MYSNPILRGLNPDPSICRAGEDYYLATSTMGFYPGVPIHHSRDLVNWHLIGHALTTRAHFQLEKIEREPMIYAPTLRYHDGTFYMITTNVHGGGNFIVTATNPAGPWSDPICVDMDIFDPSLCFDDGGKVYYTRRGPFDRKDIVQAEINPNTGELLTELRPICRGLVSDDAEGPHLYHIGEWYYLVLAEGGSRFLHMATIARAKSPWGPFEPCPHNPFVSQRHAWWLPVRSAGHADLVQAHDGSWWVVYLATRHASYDALTLLGRETHLAPVSWVDGWPVVDKQVFHNLLVNAPAQPQHPWDAEPERDDFDSPTLALEWTRLGVPDDGIFNLTERKGHLRINGQANGLMAGPRASFIGRRQQEFACVASTVVEFMPMTDDDEAGLSVYHRHDYHYDLMITCRNGKRVCLLRKCVGDIVHETAVLPVQEGSVKLRVIGDATHYTFAVQDESRAWRILGTGLTQLLTAEVVSTWSGVMLGIYASGKNTIADFDWFEYANKT